MSIHQIVETFWVKNFLEQVTMSMTAALMYLRCFILFKISENIFIAIYKQRVCVIFKGAKQ